MRGANPAIGASAMMTHEPDPPKSTSRPQMGAVRKKFATPPVKIACLTCRASRTRCNGDQPCASCVTKGRECTYKPSRRGGPRVRKKSRPFSDYQTLATALPAQPEEVAQAPILVESYIEPGAGLRPLADIWKDSDAIYDHLFQEPLVDATPDIKIPMARSYGGSNFAM
jgi:hypothetical protein